MRRSGVNRVSLGAQSFHDHHLRTLGRGHRASRIARSVDAVRDGGIGRLSLDLILAIPGQTRQDLARDLSRATALAPDHISAYVLEIEKGTPFERMVARRELPGPDDDRELRHLRIAVAQLAAAGYDRYEVSNFARPGAESRHNLAYWRDRDWIGLGAGAHSHVGRKRWRNHEDPADYAQAIARRGTAAENVEETRPPMAVFEALMMGLRLAEGVDLDVLAATYGHDIRDAARHVRVLGEYGEAGLLDLDGSRLRLTPRGMELASRVLESLLPDES
jgi:oxygen-independent coproporphyrinogen-3 oxidase